MVSVLLVEDDTAIADLYALRLRLDGFVVAVAGDSASATRSFEQVQPDVVCLDMRLPCGRGAELAASFSAAGASVVLLTNDQTSYERPPPGVSLALLKANTKPAQLSTTLKNLVSSRP